MRCKPGVLAWITCCGASSPNNRRIVRVVAPTKQGDYEDDPDWECRAMQALALQDGSLLPAGSLCGFFDRALTPFPDPPAADTDVDTPAGITTDRDYAWG